MLTMVQLPENVEAMVELRAMAELILESDRRVKAMQDFLAVITASGMEYDSADDRKFVVTLQRMSQLIGKVFLVVAEEQHISGQNVYEKISTVQRDWDHALDILAKDVQNAAEDDMVSCMKRIAQRFIEQ